MGALNPSESGFLEDATWVLEEDPWGFKEYPGGLGVCKVKMVP